MVDAAIAQFGRLDCLDNNVGIGGRGSVVEMAAAGLAPGHAGQCRQHVHGLAACHPGDEGDGGRRRDRQRFVDLRPAAARPHRLFDIKGRGHRVDPRDGGRPRAGGYPRQLRRARAGLYADGLFAADEPSRTRSAAPGLGARYRGTGLGHRTRCPLSSVGRGALHYRADPGRRRRSHSRGTRPGTRVRRAGRTSHDGAPALSRQIRSAARAPGPSGAKPQPLPGSRAQPARRAQPQHPGEIHPRRQPPRPAAARTRHPSGQLSDALGLGVLSPRQDRPGGRPFRRRHPRRRRRNRRAADRARTSRKDRFARRPRDDDRAVRLRQDLCRVAAGAR